jgi:K+-sensing histidine kinase KdpD
VIDLQRLAWGAVTLGRQPVDIATLVQRAAARWRAPGRWPTVLGTSATVRLDVSKVERIIHELLANAMSHTPPGTPVWVRTAPHGTGVLVTVEDAGPGVPREFRTAVFERFSGDSTTLSTRPALGLVCRWSFASRNCMVERPGSRIGREVVHLFWSSFQDRLLRPRLLALSQQCCIQVGR